MKRIGVISDTHCRPGPVRLPDEVANSFEGVDLIIHAGDLVHTGVIHELDLIAPVKAVCGNCDMDRDINLTPMKRVVKIEKVKIGVIHSLGGNSKSYAGVAAGEFGGKVDCVVFGHSHKSYNEYHDGVLLFNPGSATQRRAEPYRSVGLLEVDGDRIPRHEIIFY